MQGLRKGTSHNLRIESPDLAQEKTSDFHVNFHDCVYLSIEPEAKRDLYNTFDPDKPFNVHLDPPPTDCPPLVEIKQEGKASIYTTDFYFTNK